MSRGLSATDVRARHFEDVGDVNLSRNAGVTREQLEQLRHDIRSSLNDTLFTRLHNMEEVLTSIFRMHCSAGLVTSKK